MIFNLQAMNFVFSLFIRQGCSKAKDTNSVFQIFGGRGVWSGVVFFNSIYSLNINFVVGLLI